MKSVVVVVAACLLAGCSLAGMIQSGSVDYNETYEQVTNIGLVTNILRARDFAPLNFSTLSDIRTGVTASGQISESFPFGPLKGTMTRASEGTGLSLAINPSFEIAPIDTQDFTRGILTPIDPMLIKYYFDRQVSQKLLMYLLFTQISVALPTTPNETRAERAPSTVTVDQYFNDATQPDQLEKFAAFVDTVFAGATSNLHVIHANRYTPLQPVGPPFRFDPTVQNLKELLAFDPAKNRLLYDAKTRKAQLYSVAAQPEIVFCRGDVPLPLLAIGGRINFARRVMPPGAARMSKPARDRLQQQIDRQNAVGEKFYGRLPDIEKSICNSSTATMSADEATGGALFGTIYIRSVEGIIQYLGALLRNPQSAAIVRRHLKYALVSLSENAADARFGVDYYGHTYYVKNVGGGDDRTLQVLALLSQLLNLNKVASELPSTRPVEIVP
jgi:hypothetical protein